MQDGAEVGVVHPPQQQAEEEEEQQAAAVSDQGPQGDHEEDDEATRTSVCAGRAGNIHGGVQVGFSLSCSHALAVSHTT